MDREERLERMAPFTIEIRDQEMKAIHGAVHVAKRTIDQMHESEREFHTFDREEIREVEADLREKAADVECDPWGELTLTVEEVQAIEQGIVDQMCDGDGDRTDAMKRLDHLLGHATDPRT
jgi:hypothetical protein